MKQELGYVILLLLVYAVLGWLWETVYCSLNAKKFVYRGFLWGPYCPIYGFGVVGVLYLVAPYQNNLLVLYVFSVVVVTVLEFLTSYILEKIFQTTWWDYHELPLNVQGRIALPVSLFWGLGCVLIVKFVQPEVRRGIEFALAQWGLGLPLVVVSLLLLDVIYTVSSLLSFHQVVSKWSETLASAREEVTAHKTNLEKGWEDSRQGLTLWLEKERHQLHLPRVNLSQRRLLSNFARLRLKGIENIEEVKEALRNLQQK